MRWGLKPKVQAIPYTGPQCPSPKVSYNNEQGIGRAERIKCQKMAHSQYGERKKVRMGINKVDKWAREKWKGIERKKAKETKHPLPRCKDLNIRWLLFIRISRRDFIMDWGNLMIQCTITSNSFHYKYKDDTRNNYPDTKC